MRSRQYLDLLVYMAALVPTVAWARDIECVATGPSVGRVVCDRAISSNECDDIVAQPQARPDDGEPVARLTQSRQSRSACTDIRWINTAFGQGKIKSQAVGLNTAAAPAADMASIPEPAPDAGV